MSKPCLLGYGANEIINFPKKENYNDKIKKISILVLGGSQAAKVFAEVLPEIFKKLSNLGISVKIYQQCLLDQNVFCEVMN